MYEPPRIHTLKVNKKIPRFPYSRFSWESTPERWLHTSCYGSARREDRIFALTKSQASALRLLQGGFAFWPSLQPGIGRHSVYQPVGGNHPFFQSIPSTVNRRVNRIPCVFIKPIALFQPVIAGMDDPLFNDANSDRYNDFLADS